MPIHLVCECGARVIAPVKRAGQSIRCPKCDSRISVPSSDSSTPVPSSLAPGRTSRLESAISDLVTARQTDPQSTPRRNERIDPPQELKRPIPAAPSLAPATFARVEAAPKPNIVAKERIETRPSPRQEPAPSRPLAAPAEPESVATIQPTRPADVMTIAIDSPIAIGPPHIAPVFAAKATITRPIQIVTTTSSPKVDKGWLGAVYGLALLWSGLALIGVGVAVFESYTYFRAEELWRLERWAFLVIAASTVQLALAIYLVQFADWIACRAAAVVISCIAAVEAMILAVTLFSSRDAWFARFLDLSPHMQNNRAIGVALLLTLLSVLLAYTTANMSLAWQRYEERGLKQRPAT